MALLDYSRYRTTHIVGTEDGIRPEAVLYQLRSWLPSAPASVLELGCGGGEVSRCLATRGYSVTGVDISAEQLAGASGAEFINSDAVAFLESSTDRFDLILGIDFLEHLSIVQAIALMRAISPRLSDRGRCILRTPNGSSPRAGRVASGDLTHQQIYNDRSIRQLLRLSGGELSAQFFEALPGTGNARGLLRRFVYQVTCLGDRIRTAAETGIPRGHLFTENLVAVVTAVREPEGVETL
ncbi:MAG: class I SAM-dependent methyltransferase [Phycisphaerae bacterium]|jgi:2-polyprenyl-3-methyl-5-hydroxy-6-metoxy-1,4-benzoquinol methylase